MKSSKLLTKARALIADPKHWTQNCSARNQQGVAVYSRDDEAFSYCMMAATHKVATGPGKIVESQLYLRKAINSSSLSAFNDAPERTHAQVLAAFDKAIVLATEAGD